LPKATEKPGVALRNKKGWFVEGTRGGPGNPRLNEVRELALGLKRAVVNAITPEEVKGLMRQLYDIAMSGGEGAVPAAKEILERTCGKASDMLADLLAAERKGADKINPDDYQTREERIVIIRQILEQRGLTLVPTGKNAEQVEDA
jgi:hypothetical protein